MYGGKIVLHFLHGTDQHAVDPLTDQRRRDVKRCVERKAVLNKIKVLHQCVCQMPGADDDQAALRVDTENAPDLGTQLDDIIAVALLTEFAEAAEVLADLRSGDAHAVSERAGRNADGFLGMQVVQIAVVARQAADDSV